MIVAVVVTYSAPAAVLGRCLDALAIARDVDHVVVVDTGGSVDTRDGDPGNHPSIEVVRCDNRGYGAAANVGFERAASLGAIAVALLNDDVVVTRGWLPPLLDELALDGVGAVQPVLLAADTGLVSSRGVAIGRDGAGVDIGIGERLPVGEHPSDLDLFTGGAVLFDPAYLEATGGFDERYFLYYEDVDLARRGAAIGWRYRLVPASTVVHAGGVSTGADPAATHYLRERNRLWAAFAFADPLTIARAVWLSIRRLRHEPRRVHARAFAAGVAGAPARVRERLRRRHSRPGDPGERSEPER